jgi:hypothetical protein
VELLLDGSLISTVKGGNRLNSTATFSYSPTPLLVPRVLLDLMRLELDHCIARFMNLKSHRLLSLEVRLE